MNEFGASEMFLVPCCFVKRDENLREKFLSKMEFLALDQNQIKIGYPRGKTLYTRKDVLIGMGRIY